MNNIGETAGMENSLHEVQDWKEKDAFDIRYNPKHFHQRKKGKGFHQRKVKGYFHGKITHCIK